ncbi:tetratricopeptide repeat protein [Paraliomyxa miuraensis]|uniref:tetratricopeptide repeat protein n=1 Tax=Paraliomyxa miuraensis TaxID=376150 RepID=UPI00224E60E8|nr:tetratricopeptide repeat protein [Paraliomyxa miuraensis]MCX4241663.1 hypothetical protein [Paraliomyxa miuraensis]
MTTAPTPADRIHQAAAYQAQAAAWAAAGRPDHAVHLYVAALDLRPDDVRVRMMLADCLVRCNRRSPAAAEYLRVAVAFGQARRDVEALALLHQVINLDASQLVYVVVADVLRRIGRQARPLCARAAEAHLRAERWADGLNMLRLGAEIDDRNPEVRRTLARLYLGRHMITEAVTLLAEAGRLLLAAGNNAEYIEVAELILQHDPRHLETLRELPRVYVRVGEAQRAVVRLADLMRVSPGDTIGYETLAQTFAAIGRVPTALSVLERLVTELRSTGRTAQADAIIGRALGWRHDDPGFVEAVRALRAPRRVTPPPVPRPSRPTTAEGTVVLDIRDLMVAEAKAEATQIIDLGDIELEEDTQVHRRMTADVVELVLDEDSAELGDRRRSGTPPLPPARSVVSPARPAPAARPRRGAVLPPPPRAVARAVGW